MSASQHQQAAPAVRFVIPGDVFGQLCAATLHLSDALLAVTRIVAANHEALAPEVVDDLLDRVKRTWKCIDDQKGILRAVCDEGAI